MARGRARSGGSRVPVDEKVLATSACEIITELMGEVHAARIVGTLAVNRQRLFETVQPHFVVRIALGGIVLALRKFDDLWIHQIKAVLLRQSPPVAGTSLHKDIERLKIRAFCNRVIAHYSKDDPRDPKTPLSEIEGLLATQGFDSDLTFFKWTSNVVDTMEKIRIEIGRTHAVEGSKWKPAR